MESSAAAELSFSFGSRRIQGQEAGGFNGVGACDDMAWVVEKGNVFGLGDDFVVDDLLDFGQLETTQTEGEDDDDDDDNNNTKEEEHQNRNKKHHHQIQQQQQHSLAEDNSAVSFEPIPTPVSELTLPAHDAAELEWVSRIMDESLSEFQTYSAPKPYFPPQHMHMPMPMPMVTIPVKAKRSKRARTLSWSSSCSSSSSSWGSGVPLLFIDSSSSTTTTTTTTTSSSSSCSSSLSSYYYSSSSSKQKQKQKQQQQLILGHHVFDEIPASDFYYDDGSKSNNYSCVILKKQKAKKGKGKGKKRGRKAKSSSVVVVGGERQCSHCGVNKTPQWRTGPKGAKTLCNACGVRYKSGRLLPEYRPACSPSFLTHVHSNSHRKVLEMRRNKGEDDELLQVLPPPSRSSDCLLVVCL